MELRRLIEGVEVKKIVGDTLKEVDGIAYHSKQIDTTSHRGGEFSDAEEQRCSH